MIATAGPVELGDQLEGRVGVVEVVVAELLALELRAPWRCPGALIGASTIERRPLVRVLAIAQRLLQRRRRRRSALREGLAALGREPAAIAAS